MNEKKLLHVFVIYLNPRIILYSTDNSNGIITYGYIGDKTTTNYIKGFSRLMFLRIEKRYSPRI